MPRGRPPKDRSREEAVSARREQVRKNVQAFRERKRLQQQQGAGAGSVEGEDTPKSDDEDTLRDIVSRLGINDERYVDGPHDNYAILGDVRHADIVTSPAMESKSLMLSTRIPQEISSAPHDRQQFVSICVAKFNSDSHVDAGPHWTATLPEIVNKNNILDFSIQAICLMEVGKIVHRRWLLEEGNNYYGKALRTLTRRLDVNKNLQEEIFMAMMALSVYELSPNINKNDEGWLFHYRAAFRYLKQLSQANRNWISNSQPVFHFLETLCVFDALGSRKSSYFSASNAWSHSLDRWGGETYGPLLRLTTRVPALLEAHDAFLLSPGSSTAPSVSSRPALLNECFRLEDRFLEWHHRTTSHLNIFTFTSEPSQGKQHVKFPNLFIARLHLLYWSALVLLLDTASSLFRSMHDNNNINTSPGSSSSSSMDTGPLPTSLMLQDSLSKSQNYALWIRQSVAFCLNPDNGIVGRSLLLLPIWITRNHHREAGEPEERQQCDDILEVLGQRGLNFGDGEDAVMGVHWKAGGLAFFDRTRKGRADLGAYSL